MTSGIAQISASEIIGLKDKKESHPVSNGRVGDRKEKYMKYNYKVWEDNKKVVLEGQTSGRGTRKEQEEEARLEAMKKGYKTRLDSRYSLQMKATTLY